MGGGQMPRRPKAKNTLTAGERVALYEAEREKRQREGAAEDSLASFTKSENAEKPSFRERKALAKPQSALVSVDFSVSVGKVSAMHGMCNGPVSYGADLSEMFREIGVPCVRFDCTDSALSACAVDLSRIFKNPDADPALSENYDFSYTDRYVEAARKSGAEIIFRLGESPDPLLSGKKVEIPEDLDRLALVCVNVIKHYNDGWAGGYSLGIDRFEIWSHDSSLDGRECLREFELYRRVASAITIYDGTLRVGGMGFDGLDTACREFVRYCAKNRVRLDFLTLSCFGADPREMGEQLRTAMAYVRNCGLSDTEIVVAKWGYLDVEALEGQPASRVLAGGGERMVGLRRKLFEAQASVKGAAYVGAFMLEAEGIPGVNAACFFDAQPLMSPWCAIADRLGRPQKPYYAFKAFGEIFRAGNGTVCECVEQQGYRHSGVYAKAAISDSGECYVMLSSFDGCGTVDLRLDGIPGSVCSAELYLLDGVKDLASGECIPISGMKKRMVLSLGEYSIALIKLF